MQNQGATGEAIPALSPEEAEAHSQAVADVLNSVLTSQIQIVDAEKEEDKLKNLIAESSPNPNSGKHVCTCCLSVLHTPEMAMPNVTQFADHLHCHQAF